MRRTSVVQTQGKAQRLVQELHFVGREAANSIRQAARVRGRGAGTLHPDLGSSAGFRNSLQPKSAPKGSAQLAYVQQGILSFGERGGGHAGIANEYAVGIQRVDKGYMGGEGGIPDSAKSEQSRQVMAPWGLGAQVSEERLQVFFRALLGMKADERRWGVLRRRDNATAPA